MQRASISLRRTRLPPGCLRQSSSCLATTIYNPSSSIRLTARSFSASRISATALPAFDFLHPPVVRDAVKSAKRIKRLTRGYHDDFKDDSGDGEFVPSSEGWSEAEIRRQEEEFRTQELFDGQENP